MKFKLNSTTIYISVLVVIVIVFGVVYTVIKQPEKGLEIVAAEIETANEPYGAEGVTNKITVHIVGEVVNSDVYILDAGSRVKDIIDMAGGVTKYADIESINLAAYLQDAEQIFIPKKQNDSGVMAANQLEAAEEPAVIQSSGANKLKSSKININTADMSDLMTLNGIGEAIADSIIVYREANGKFKSIEEIKNVDRIGSKTFDKIKDFISVN